MLAEAIHSVADSGNQALLLLGGRQARKRPTAAHPFGYGRERYIYAFIVSIVLFSVGGLFALYEAYHKGHELTSLTATPTTRCSTAAGGGCRSWCCCAAIVMESLSFRTAIRETGHGQGRRVVRRVHPAREAARAARSSCSRTSRRCCGLVFALLGVGLSLLTEQPLVRRGRHRADRPAARRVAVVLAIETKSLLLGESASVEAEDRIAAALREHRRHRPDHPPEDPAPRPRRAPRRRQDRGPPRRTRPTEIAAAIDAAEAAHPRRRADRHA